MKRISTPSRLSALALLAACLLAAPAWAQQVCKTNIPASTPASRFDILPGGKEVKDKQTGLIWQRCALGQSWDGNTCTGTARKMDWKAALKAAKELGAGWRLPNVMELSSIVEEQCSHPAVNTTVFPGATSDFFWSASPGADGSGYAWGVFFSSGYVNDHSQGSHYAVRAVRASQ